MTLKDCTKEELIFVIKRLQFYSLSNDHCVQRALGDVEEEREARKLREARRLSALQQLRAGGPGDDRVGLSLGVLRFALELRNRRDIVPGLGMRPVRTGHAFLCHSVYLLNQKMQEYISLMSPYDGAPLMDVPEDVFVRAHAALKKSRAADMKWRKLMGFPTDPPAGKKRRAASGG